MDVYNTIEQEESIVEASARLKNLRWYLRLWVFLVEEQSWLFLFVLGTFGALVIIFRCFAVRDLRFYKKKGGVVCGFLYRFTSEFTECGCGNDFNSVSSCFGLVCFWSGAGSRCWCECSCHLAACCRIWHS